MIGPQRQLQCGIHYSSLVDVCALPVRLTAASEFMMLQVVTQTLNGPELHQGSELVY